ncbi:MAG: PadR family transcriptional regulator, partial [Candidatus Obscuribacterales bacterium]
KNEHFDKSVAYFWPADQTQIYKTLDKLVEQGFATSEIEFQSDRPNRKVYTITKQGKAELERWLSEAIEPPMYRDPLLVQLFFSDFIDRETMIAVLKSAKVKHEECLRALKAVNLPATAKCADYETLAARLTLELGFKSKEAYINWLDEAIAAITAMEKKSRRAAKR